MLRGPAVFLACLLIVPSLSTWQSTWQQNEFRVRSMAGKDVNSNLNLRGGEHECVGLSWGRDKHGYPVLLEGDHDREQTEKYHHHNAVVVKLCNAMKEKWAGKLDGETGGVAMRRGKAGGNQVHDSGYKKGARLMDMSELNHVLEVDEKALTASAEPLVTMEELVAATFPRGLLPKVVPEFKHITVGGAIMGAALESSSHRHGQFLDVCDAVTVLLGDGTIQECSTTKAKDLFNALSGSYGSLAILLLARIQLQPAGPFVKVKYALAFGAGGTIAALQARTAAKSRAKSAKSDPPPEFVEGMQLRPSGAAPLASVIMTADFVEAKERFPLLPLRRFTKHWGLWYYEHAARIGARLLQSKFWMARPLHPLSNHTKWTPVLPGMFLMSSSFFPIRLFAGWLFATKRLFGFLKKAPPTVIASKMIIMDAYMPAANAGKLIEYVREHVPISTPLCSPHGHHAGLMVNVGIYGRVCDGRGKEYSKALERKIAELGGRKMLYSQNFFSRDEFWGTAGSPWGEVMPKEREYQAEGVLLDLFSKVCEAARAVKRESLWNKLGQFLARLML